MSSQNTYDDTVLKVQRLEKYFPVKASYFSTTSLNLKAVDGVNFDVKKGETMGLVGESGCGKTTVGRSVLRLYEPNEGRVYLHPQQSVVESVDEMDLERLAIQTEYEERKLKGESEGALKSLKTKMRQLKRKADETARDTDILSMNGESLKQARRQIQMIFQDPWASLNPHMMVKDLIGEGPKEFGLHRGSSLDGWVMELLDRVGLPNAAANRYPHEFSGGQRQRICIARALALTPSVVVCDEPVSALDVSIQAQVLNLLIGLQQDFDLTYVFIAHDLSVVEYISDRVAVMYLGKMVETANSKQLYGRPRHPYTQSLLSAVPVADPTVNKEEIILEGDVPSPVNPPSGCSFHNRCRYKTDICTKVTPILEKDENGHKIACHNPPNG
ncbi:ABC transporter ATP-binding protein [Salinispira pacifica]|uniref:Oligopeptide transport ATP-binding protein OppF n=1 Tax=Salinispira pacifica TaxID=1307761 RepID=V5WKP4_9SPIO|nr:oligopeptide/dipeptide ABC transporter ATP-binding protein [Salinispira pacifica]AHC16397.1 Oligopeptide transport ATP-binding protein OppF [Salinispira pacifica]